MAAARPRSPDGNLGLIRAVQKYDPAKGYRFAAFATWWIRLLSVTSGASGWPARRYPCFDHR